MSTSKLCYQVSRPGPVFCHYTVAQGDVGVQFCGSKRVVLLTFGGWGHAFGLGWVVR